MNKIVINTKNAPTGVGTYSQGIAVDGHYFFSGQIGMDPTTMELANDFEGQLHLILQNIDGLLDSAGLARDNIVKTTIYLTDLKYFDLVNQAYNKFFSIPFPARSCLQVSALPKDALIEIELLAIK